MIESNYRQSESAIINRLTKQAPYPKDVQRELVMRAQAGDLEARSLLVESNMRLVCQIAFMYARKVNRYTHRIDASELISAGAIGCLTAVSRFDCSREDVGFVSYAQFWIRKEICITLNRNDLLRMDLVRRQAKSGVDAPENIVMIKADDSEMLFQKLVAPDIVSETDAGLDIERALSVLTPMERELVVHVFGLNGLPQVPIRVYEVQVGWGHGKGGRRLETAMTKMQLVLGTCPTQLRVFRKEKHNVSFYERKRKASI